MAFQSFRIKQYLFATIILLFGLLIVQQKLKLFKESPLKGDIKFKHKPHLGYESWFNGTFQQQYEKYFNEQIGFRNFFLRLNNQVAFSFFNKAKANGVIVGKDNYLYESNYIKAYYGLDSISDEAINGKLEKLKFLQDTLGKLNIDLLLIYNPGKAAFFPEYIPGNLTPSKTYRTNYSQYIKKSKELHINHIDFYDYFLKQKQFSKYPLYPQYGIHWSVYGYHLALDSIIKFIELRRNIPMNHLVWNNVEVSDLVRGTDYDIADGMNLLFRLPTFPMGYPKSSFENNPVKVRPHVLAISDSYYWSFFNLGVTETIFSNGKFWYYNNQVYPDSYEKPTLVADLNLKKEIESKDIIIIMVTDANLPQMGWGFIENAYSLYSSGEQQNKLSDAVYKEKVQNYMSYIKTQKGWFENVKKYAAEKNITTDSSLTISAMYMVDQELKKN